MNLTNPFRRGASSKAKPEGEAVMDVMRPWWAWGPLGLVWFAGHDTGSTIDAGHINHHVDGGNFNHTIDPGGGFGGFDGGGGGGAI